MKTLSSEELCQAVKGCFLKKVNKKGFQGVTIDSRDKDISNKIFFAISGKRFDGHDFIPEVLKKNVGAIIVHRSLKPYFWEEKKNAHPVIIQVKDTLTSLRDLASFWRKKTRLEVIGITGSSGKTTTKHLCFQLLQDNFSVMASPKSFNNQYGVPLSLLSVQEGKNYLIQEIGINRKGEIQGLCDIARPHIATVVTVGSAHIELFGSKENIAKEKEYIYKSLPSEGVAVFNKDNSYTTSMYENRKKFSVSHFLFFSSRDPSADVFLKIDQVHEQSLKVSGHVQGHPGQVSLSVTSPVHLNNVLAAVTLSLAVGLSPSRVWEILPTCTLPSGRNHWLKLSCGARALFDAYNASPESVSALLTHFSSSSVKGRKILILGDILEIGSHLKFFQKLWAKILAESQLELLWFIGNQAEAFGNLLKESHFQGDIYLSQKDDPVFAKKILSGIDDSFVLAFKASRKTQMEKVLAYFKPLMEDNELFLC